MAHEPGTPWTMNQNEPLFPSLFPSLVLAEKKQNGKQDRKAILESPLLLFSDILVCYSLDVTILSRSTFQYTTTLIKLMVVLHLCSSPIHSNIRQLQFPGAPSSQRSWEGNIFHLPIHWLSAWLTTWAGSKSTCQLNLLLLFTPGGT